MTSYEAMIAFAAFLAALSVLASAMAYANNAANNNTDYTRAKLQAEKCAGLVDGLYANAGGDIKNIRIDCFIKNERIASRVEGQEAGAILLYSNASNIETLSGANVLVKTDAHYK